MPTAERPESGTIGSAGVPLFTVEHWLEDGEHVFRSAEFDMTVGAPDIGAAADRFIESAYDLWGFMEEQQNLTEGELQDSPACSRRGFVCCLRSLSGVSVRAGGD